MWIWKKAPEKLYHGSREILAGPDGIYKECRMGKVLETSEAFVVTKVGHELFVCNNSRFMERVDNKTLLVTNYYILLHLL